MTVPSLLLPLLMALALAAIVATVQHRLPPQLAARSAVVTLAVVAASGVPTLWIVSLEYLSHVPMLRGVLHWCGESAGAHPRIPRSMGLPIVAVAAVGAARGARVLQSNRRLRSTRPGSIEVASHNRAFAYTLPGPGGRIVVSRGLVDLLDIEEQAVVIAHEHAHARYRHDRYLLIGQFAAAAIPPLRPLTSRLRYSLERWADESAAEHCGDRAFVARTIGKAALHTATPAGVLGFGGLGVPARVSALLSPSMLRPRSTCIAGLWLLIAATGGVAAVQLRILVAAFCPG